MKKLFIILCLILSAAIPANAINEEILDGGEGTYSPSTKQWSVTKTAPDKIIYKKRTSSGTGSFSEYYQQNDSTPAFVLGSNYEFVRGGKLIAVINKDLKFAEVKIKNGKVQEKELSKRAIQKLFPDTKIIKISSFRNQKITIKSDKFPQQYILWNNTNKNFHKYFFNPQNTDRPFIKGSFRADREGQFTFSHFGKDVYTIIIK